MDLRIRTSGPPLGIVRRYDSGRPVDGPLGIGWSSSLVARLFYATYLLTPPSTLQRRVYIPLSDGIRLQFIENPDGVSYAPQNGRYDTLVKNADGTFDLTPQRSRARSRYSSTGLLLSHTDENGNSQTLTYDPDGKLQRISDDSGSGRYIDVYWGANGRISTVQDSANRQVQYGYDGQGRLTSVTDPAGRSVSYAYVEKSLGSLLSRISDHRGRIVTDITYDSSSRVASITEEGETYRYTDYGIYQPNETVKKDSRDVITRFLYNPNGLITDRTFQDGFRIHTDYNSDGSVQQVIDEVGVRTFYTYDSRGNVASVTKDYQGPSAVRFDYAYDPSFPDKVTSITPKNPASGTINRDWQEWRYDYYQAGSPSPGSLFHVYRVRSDGTQELLTTYVYDTRGRVTRVTDARGSSTDYEYDPAGNLIRVTAPANNDAGMRPVMLYGYDSLGRVTTVTDPLGKVTTYTYDALDRVLTATLPRPSPSSTLNFTTTYTYDNFDPVSGLDFTHVTDPNGRLTKQGYNQFGQLVQSVDSLNNVTVYGYARGLLSSIRDANGNVTIYNYDVRRRLENVVFPDGKRELYRYFPDNLLEIRTHSEGPWITYTYDRLKRLTVKSRMNDGAITYTYAGQKLAEISETFHGTTENYSFSYDTAYRLSSEIQSTRGTVSYSHFPDDTVASYSVAGGPTATYTRYPDGSLDTIQWSPVAGSFKYRYNLRGQPQSVTFPNGLVRGFSHDDQGRLLQLSNTDPVAGNLATYAYEYDLNHSSGAYDRLGQRVSMTATVPSQGLTDALTKYYYDPLYQLTRVDYPNVAPFNGEFHSWTYDAIGNRLTNTVNSTTDTYSYQRIGTNPNNWQRLTSDGTSSYTYDPRGNTQTKTGSNFVWTDENRLRSISGAAAVGYRYDYQGRRSSKTVDAATTSYLYEGLNLVAEAGASSADYLFGPGIDEPLAMSRAGQVYYYATDGLGSVNLLADAGGVVQNTYLYDAWGQTRAQTGSIANPFTYTAREQGEAGLNFYRARYYQPSIGRFLAEDPLRSVPISDRYAYARNSPTNYLDPTGLQVILPKPCPPKCQCGPWSPLKEGVIDRGLRGVWVLVKAVPTEVAAPDSGLPQATFGPTCVCHYELVGVVRVKQPYIFATRLVTCNCNEYQDFWAIFGKEFYVEEPSIGPNPPPTVTTIAPYVQGQGCLCEGELLRPLGS